MATSEALARNGRTRRDIKRALLELLARKPLDSVSMSELAREAQVSRSTLYQHYGNVHEAYADVVREFDERTAPVMTQLECYEGVAPDGTLPFCALLRKPEEFGAAVDDPRFLDMFINRDTILEEHSFYKTLVASGYPQHVAKALSIFQINGCFNAVKRYGADEATWREVRDAIDTFICGGIDACQQKKRHQMNGKRLNAKGN